MGDYNSTPITQLQPGISVLSTDVYAAVDVTDPTQSPSGSTKKYTISQMQDFLTVSASGSNIVSAKAATTNNLVAAYSNGTGGVGSTLTNAGPLSALIIDGIALSIGDRVLVWLQVSQFENGIYEVTVVGDIATRWILTRVSDYNGHVPGQVSQGDFVGVTLGNTNSLEFWFMTSNTPLIVGIDPIIFQRGEAVVPPPFSEPWYNVTVTPQVMVGGSGYVSNTGGFCTLILPTAIGFGEKIQIQARGASFFRIQQNVGQQIFFGNIATTIGITGYIQSVDLGSSMTLVCTVANQEFYMLGSPQGSTFTVI